MTLDKLIPKDTLIIVALERELPKTLLPNWNIVYSGVGKVNASFSVVNAYNKFKPRVITVSYTHLTLPTRLSV